MKLGAINQKLIGFGLKLTKKNVKKIIYMCTTFEKWEAYIEETKIEESDKPNKAWCDISSCNFQFYGQM